MNSPNLASPSAPRWRAFSASIVAVAAVLFTLAGCSSAGESETSSADSGDSLQDAGPAAARKGADSAMPASAAQRGSIKETAYDKGSPAEALLGPALIKTAAITLEADSVGPVITGINSLAIRVGGQIASEDTATDEAGVQVRSHIELRVPADDFDRAVQEIVGLGDLVAKTRTSEDVTARLVDVESRVASAQDSIAALRTLFNRATKLGEVIALERELSDREADLEALQAQQRSLRAQTSMSTIIVDVSAEQTSTPRERDASGFLAGIEQGWDGLVRFVVGFSHAVGLLLPLGTLALLTAFIGWVVARRFLPRRVARTSE